MIAPDYRKRLTTGIVHFGPGAFHRAHQADYIDRLSYDDPRWGIAAASLRNPGTIEALRRQDGLYTLAILDRDASFRTIGVHNRFFGPGDTEALRRQFLDPAIRVISSTVTEKGYCLGPDGTLDFAHADIRHDLEQPSSPISLIGWIALALSLRRSNELQPPAVICCDNMTANGRKLGQAVVDFAGRSDPDLARWIEGQVRFPNTMVDSITPATDDTLRHLVREWTGSDDAVPVRREAYSEWVIEDVLPTGTPDLRSVGAVLTSDVGAWEKAKLRILNGSHSTLAYLGLLRGHETVADAMADDALRKFVEQLISEDVIPSLQPSSLDLVDYARRTFERFRNPAIHHRLSQIAWDGSQKLPYRILDTATDALGGGRPIDRMALPVAGWIRFLERQFGAGETVVDPLADDLRPLALGGDPVRSILQLRQVFSAPLGPDSRFGQAVFRAHAAISGGGLEELMSAESA